MNTPIQWYPHKKNGDWLRRGVVKIVLHHLGDTLLANGDEEKTLFILDRTDQYHKFKDWDGYKAPCIAYHYAIDLKGRIFQLNEDDRITWHAGYANDFSLGVVVLGNFEEYKPTRGEEKNIMFALDTLQKRFFERYKLMKTDWVPHSTYKETLCCGKYLKTILEEWQKEDR